MLDARDQAHLADVVAELARAGVSHAVVRESEGPHAGELMAVGCAPGPRDAPRRVLSSLRLFRRCAT